MALEIFKLVGSVFVDTDKANESLDKTDKKAEGVGTELSKGITTASKWGSSIATAAANGATAIGKGIVAAVKWGAGITAAASAGAAALYKVATNAASAMDEIDKGSAKIGISKQAYQEWNYVLGQNGMSIDKLETGMKTLVSQMDSAASGTASACENFDKLGISIYDANGNLKDQETILNETMYALADMENGTEKARLATELFGKAGIEMMPMLNNGAEGIAELTERAHDLGLVVSDEAVTAGVTLGDTIDDVKQSFTAVVNKIGVEVMPIIQALLDWILANMPAIQSVLSAVFGFIENAIGLVSIAITFLAGKFDEKMPAIQAVCSQAITSIVTFWNDNLRPCLEAIGNFIQNVLAPAFTAVFKGGIVPTVEAAFQYIKSLWHDTLKPIFVGITDFLTGVFTLDFEKAMNGIDSICKGVINSVIAGFEGLVNGGIGALNGLISGINWLAGKAGNLLGIDIQIPSVPLVSLPRLEYGGVLEAGQVGILEGSGAEAVVPLEKNREWISKVATEMQNQGIGGGKETLAVLEEILALLKDGRDELPDILIDAMVRGLKFKVNNREWGRLIREVEYAR